MKDCWKLKVGKFLKHIKYFKFSFKIKEMRSEFRWFDHGWAHYKYHQLNSSSIRESMLYNYLFAQNHDLPSDSFYSVSPHHSGIYPSYHPLYKYWKDIWLVKASSTEGYPHLKPSYLRRGFIHDGIMVLPRQTCGIFTHTMFFKNYPNGIERLVAMINGGEVFQALLLNQVVVFMTHMTNYANDRLAIFVFKKLFEYATKWTNLQFKSLEPVPLAEKYFELYPDFKEPIWTNPCDDKRHLNIWSFNQSFCKKFPKFVIIGPQKTGQLQNNLQK